VRKAENLSRIVEGVEGTNLNSAYTDDQMIDNLSPEEREEVMQKHVELIGDETNIYRAGPVGFEALHDKILVLEDEFRSGYECDKCNATGKLKCPDCDDGSSRLNHDVRCKSCNMTMLVDCAECKGKGALLVIADAAQRRPTTGRIVSVGSEVELLRRGDSVLYPSFCGEVMDLKGSDAEGREIQIVVRMLKEKEAIARVTGHMELRRVSKQQFNVGG
jgi:co-chaperonin GroES (HSP10)